MVPEHLASLPLDDIACPLLERIEQEGTDADRTDEADAIGVRLGLDAEVALCAGSTNVCLRGVAADREENAIERRAGHAPEEVGLVLVLISRAKEPGRSSSVSAGAVLA